MKTSKLSKSEIQQLNTTASEAICVATNEAQEYIAELLQNQNMISEDQRDFFRKINNFFGRIHQVLLSIGTGQEFEGSEWETAKKWAEIYLATFLLVDRGWPYIKKALRDSLPQAHQTPAALMPAFLRDHAYFLAQKSGHGDYTFSVKSWQAAYRNQKKLNTTDRLDVKAYKKLEDKVFKDFSQRFTEPHFLFLIACLKICHDAARNDSTLRIHLNHYNQIMSAYGEKQNSHFREGAKGFGFRNGQLLSATSGGSYKPAKDLKTENL